MTPITERAADHMTREIAAVMSEVRGLSDVDVFYRKAGEGLSPMSVFFFVRPGEDIDLVRRAVGERIERADLVIDPLIFIAEDNDRGRALAALWMIGGKGGDA